MLNKELLLFNSAGIYTGASLTLNLVHTVPRGAIRLIVVRISSGEQLLEQHFYEAGMHIIPFKKGCHYHLSIETSTVYVKDSSNVTGSENAYDIVNTDNNAYLEIHLRSGGGN